MTENGIYKSKVLKNFEYSFRCLVILIYSNDCKKIAAAISASVAQKDHDRKLIIY